MSRLLQGRRPWVLTGLGLAALGAVLLVLGVAIDYALPALVLGLVLAAYAAFGRQRKAVAEDDHSRDYHFEQERYAAMDDDDTARD